MVFGFFKKSPGDELDALIKQEEEEQNERINQQLRKVKNERPPLPSPSKGNISVGYKHIDDAVYVWIELSEVDKQVLSQAQLLDTTVDEIEDAKAIQEQVNSYSEIMDETTERIDAQLSAKLRGRLDYTPKERRTKLDEYRQELVDKNSVSLRDILSNPYRRAVTTPAEAAAYIEKLKTKILPKVKSLIETHSSPLSGSFDL